jgi:uncharacterized protein (TIGR03118 family)
MVTQLSMGVIEPMRFSEQTSHCTQTVFVSNVSGAQQITDPNLVDPWGIAFSSGSPAWIANTGTGVATLYTGGAQSPPVIIQPPLIVSIPGPGPGGSGGTPTGIVFNSATQFSGTPFNSDLFLFSTLNGGIFGWRNALGTTAETLQTPSTSNVYTGLAYATTGSVINPDVYLYAANFRSGTIDVTKGSSSSPNLIGHFLDPNLPAGFAPFNIQTLNGKLFVTYAQQDASKSQPVFGPGKGFVDVFNLDGTAGLQNGLVRLVTNGPLNAPLNAPFGLAIAPMGFGKFGGDLLVGNRGDGTINAYDPNTGAFIGTLTDALGNPISNTLLTALAFGNGNSFSSNALLFTAGDGVFGEIVAAATPLPAALPLFATGLGALGLLGWRKKKKAAAHAG